MLEIRVGTKYRLGKKLKKGAAGDIFLGSNIQTNEEVAIKLEVINTYKSKLFYESKVLRLLQDGQGIPKIHWYGSDGGYNALVIEILGPSLEDLLLYCERKFSLNSTMMIASQLIDRLEFLHSKCYVHRDVKPANFLLGTGEKINTIYMIDYGLTKKYCDPLTLDHAPYKNGKSFTGTIRYASLNTHAGIEQSRRDDIESLFYVLAYFLLGNLPWQGISVGSRTEKCQKVFDRKKLSINDRTYSDLHSELIAFYAYSRSLKFEDSVDYGYLRSLVKKIASIDNYNLSFIFDWTLQGYLNQQHLIKFSHSDIKSNLLNNESNVALNESNIIHPEIPTQIHKSKENTLKNKQKCIIF